jgi:hypothetical protein
MSEVSQAVKDCVDAIDYAINDADGEGVLFLKLWQEGDWKSIDEEFSDFEISDELRNPNIVDRNTTLKIMFKNGDVREYTVTDQVEDLISKGHLFEITAAHPCKSEMFQLSILN